MNDLETMISTLQIIDNDAVRRTRCNTYYNGKQPLAFLAPEARTALGNRFGVLNSNTCRVAVNALVERLRITGFTGPEAIALWEDWRRNDLDQLAPVAHREALITGEAFVIVWADAAGNPQVTIESPEQVAVQRHPATGTVTAAAKRIEHKDHTEAVLYLTDRIVKFRSQATGAVLHGFEAVETIPNPLGMVPVVPLRNTERLTGPAASELDDLLPLVDAQSKLLADLMVASEYAGRPRRWATGIELEEEDVLDADGNPTGETLEVNPYPEGSRMMVAEPQEAKFGQLPAADLAGYEAAIRVLQAQISAVSGLAPHYLGVHGDQPASADALRASEAALVAKVEARQLAFGRAWEAVARLMLAVRTGRRPETVNVAVQWADAATRSIAQEADAIVKLFAAGLIPQSYALQRLGYSDDDIRQITAASPATTTTPATPA
ncbi:SPP1 Gp6-like portal protein [Luteococcus japonicus]|uniref:SPP1 Gp6-like portal protein n=1 Tax=Luteococcus japonicus TaxID=33984 RepID=A0A3N1ZQV4_9ACTN|nr:phage portal protein [Luteococcus japonicus]ROR53280.1 SPP1 Gp6-like portal protein [Luteococcus japonicus]